VIDVPGVGAPIPWQQFVEPVIGAPRTEPKHTRAALIDRATY
jgi:hypothetical protein